MTITRLLSISIRVTGVAALLLGALFWTGHGLSLVKLHMALGIALVFSLWSLAIVTALRGGPTRLVVVAIAWGFLLPVLGFTQARLFPGSLHWVVRVAHMAIGGFAIRLGELLAKAPAGAGGRSREVTSSSPGMRRVLILVTLALAIGGGGAAAVWARPGRKSVPAIQLSGTIEARDVQVGSLVGGRVIAVHVDEGAQVTAGQTLVTLDPDLLDLQIGEQQAQRDQGRARLALALAGPRSEEKERARVDWQNAEAERMRLQALLADNAISRRDYDNAAAAAHIKRAALEEMERGTRQEEIAGARAALAEAESRLAYLRRQREETVVTAPAAGLVQSFDLRPGDLVNPNQPVLDLLETGQLWVRVYVPETQLGLIRVGQPAAITVDAFRGRAFAGTVVEIRGQGEYTPRNIQTLDQRSDLVFGVKVAVAPTPELKPGMAALVSIQP